MFFTLRLYVGDSCCYQVLQNNWATEGHEVSAWVLMAEGLPVPYCCRKAKHRGDARISGVWQVSKPSSGSVPTISWGPGTWWQYQEPLRNLTASYEVLLILWRAAARRSKKEMGHLLGDHYGTSSVWGFPLYPQALSTQLSCWAINYWLLLGLTEWGHLRCVEMQVGKILTSDACELHCKAITT